MNNERIQGVIAYPITPFTKDNKVDLPLFKRLVERLVKSGSNGIAPLGSTGVLPYLNLEEKRSVIKACIEQVAGRLPVIVGVSNLTTADTVTDAQFAEKQGADAVMIIPMSYWKLTDEEIYTHFETVNQSISIPIMVYNNPATGGVDMSPVLLQRLLTLSHVSMIKESTGDIQRMYTLRKHLGEDIRLFNGANHLALGAFTAGAIGWCTAAPNLIPHLTTDLYNAIQKNNLPRAQKVFYHQVELLQFMVAKGLPRVVKAGLELMNEEAGYLRAPLLPLNPEEKNELKRLLEKCHQKMFNL